MYEKLLLRPSVTLCACRRTYIRDPPPSSAIPHRKKIDQYEAGEVPVMSDEPEYPEILPPTYATGLDAEMHAEKLRKAEVEAFGTIHERLDFLNPYERAFTPAEDKYWRPWHKKQIRPRLAWRLDTPTPIYDSLPFYQFATRTALVPRPDVVTEHLARWKGPGDGTDDARNDEAWDVLQLSNRDVSDSLLDRVKILSDKIVLELDARSNRLSPTDESVEKEKDTNVRTMLRHLMETVVEEAAASGFSHFADAQLDLNARVESFWIRAGYRHHYPAPDAKDEQGKPFTQYEQYRRYDRLAGDTVAKRGELAFCHRANLAAQLRMTAPLRPTLGLSERCIATVPKYDYYPSVLGYEADPDILFMLPGYEFGDSEDFASTICVAAPEQMVYMSRWDGHSAHTPSVFENSEPVTAIAIANAFSTLIGQAHFLGFTQHHPLTYPLSTHVLVSLDGQNIHAFKYQLNTMDMAYEWRNSGEQGSSLSDENGPSVLNNVIFDLGIKQLFFRDPETGKETVNADSLRFLLRMILEEPLAPQMDLRPYLPKVTQTDEVEEKHEIVAKYANL